MNVHHLELFFYVAKFEGITEAAKNMPYGIGQPAVSQQVADLEKYLGVRLFHRRPFALTPAGIELFRFISPFFSRLEQVEERIKGEESQHLRLAASGTVLTHHLPNVLEALRREFPDLRLTLKDLSVGEIEGALHRQEADVAITILHGKKPTGIKSVKLLELPLGLLVPANSNVEKFKDIADRAVVGRIHSPLIALPKHERVTQIFHDGLSKHGLVWNPTMEVTDLELIHAYVSHGFGLGLIVDIPGVELPVNVRRIKLPADFPSLTIGAQHTGNRKKAGNLKRVAERFIDLAREYASKL